MFTEHKSFVQGVAFDPQGAYVATMSSDRSVWTPVSVNFATSPKTFDLLWFSWIKVA